MSKLIFALILVQISLLSWASGQHQALVQYVRESVSQIRGLCNGNPPAECNCDCAPNAKLSPPFVPLKFFGCCPGECTCDTGEKLSARAPDIQKIFDLCPAGEMDYCVCASDNKRKKYPFGGPQFMFKCRPRSCKCKNESEERLVTAFGCRNGGVLYCPSDLDLSCDGQNHLTEVDVITATVGKKCVCNDNKRPRCKSNSQLPKCPDNEDADPDVGNAGIWWDACDA